MNNTAVCTKQDLMVIKNEIEQNFLTPVDETLPLRVRFELYKSRELYLESFYSHVFKEVNKGNPEWKREELGKIQEARAFVKCMLGEVVLLIINESLNKRRARNSYTQLRTFQ